MNLQKHFCLVILRRHTEIVLAEYEVEAADWYYARHQAANLFRKEYPDEKRDWCVDSCLLD